MTKEERIISNLYEAKKIELGTHKVDLAIADDLRKAENDFKTAILTYSDIESKFESAKSNLKKQSDSAYKLALKYNSMANELGLKAIDNVSFKTIDAYFQSDIVRNLK
jgi:hypothetical protein